MERELKEALSSSDPAARSKATQSIADRVVNRTLGLNTLVDALGPQLTSDDDLSRTSGTRVLADVVTRAAEAKAAALDATATKVLAAFFVDRLEDVIAQSEALRGLRAIVSFSNGECFADASEALGSAEAIAAHVRPATLSPESRKDAVDALVAAVSKSDVSGAAAVRIASGLRKLFVAERDPRVLLSSFTLMARLARSAGADALSASDAVVQDLFDSFSVYYPILFVPRAPAGNSVTSAAAVPVTKEDLVAAIRSCFISSPAFARLAVPFLLDKTQSSIAGSRADAFTTLAACLRAFGTDACGTAIGVDLPQQCFDSVAAGAFVSNTESVHDGAASLLAAVIEGCPSSETIPRLEALVEDCVKFLTPAPNAPADEPFDKEASDAVRSLLPRILFAQSKSTAAVAVAPKAAKAIAERATASSESPDRVLILAGAMADMLKVLAAAPQPVCETPFASECAVALMDSLSSVASSTKDRGIFDEAARGIASAAFLKCIPDARLVLVVKSLVGVALDKAKPTGVRSDAIAAGIAGIGANRQMLVIDHAVPMLLSPGKDSDGLGLRSAHTIASAHPALFRCVVSALSELALPKLGTTPPGPALEAMRDCVKVGKRPDKDKVSEAKWCALLRSLAGRITSSLIIAPQPVNPATVGTCRAIFRSIAEALPQTEQLAFLHETLTAFAPTGTVHSGLMSISPLLSASVASVSPANVAVAGPLVLPVVLALSEAPFAPECARDAAALAAASVVNKLPESADAIVNGVVDRVLTAKAPLSLAWMARGLLLRSHKRGAAVVSALANLVGSSADAAKAFSIVAPPNCPVDEGLVQHAGAVEGSPDGTSSYGERVFAASFDVLLASHERDVANPLPLIALASVLASAPAKELESNATRCLPVALRVLGRVGTEADGSSGASSSDDSAASMIVFASLAAAAPNVVAPHLAAALAKLCSVAVGHRKAKTRVAALAALLSIRRHVSEHQTLIHQSAVVAALLPALDDPKRAVRAEAVRCRNAWVIFS